MSSVLVALTTRANLLGYLSGINHSVVYQSHYIWISRNLLYSATSPPVLRCRPVIKQEICCTILFSLIFQRNLRPFLSTSKCYNTSSPGIGLHHSCLSSCPHYPHILFGETQLLQLQTCCVAVKAINQMFCSY